MYILYAFIKKDVVEKKKKKKSSITLWIAI